MTNQWIDRWEHGQIGWHEESGNSSLKKYWRATGKHVLVPFCGKTNDLLWLEEQGNEVTGVELSELAILAFFAENNLEFVVSECDLKLFQAKTRDVKLYCGDYFAFGEGPFDAHFDRGALIALPPDRRPAYAAHTSALLAAGAEQLVVSVEYDQSIANGPPYSVDGSEVCGYWPSLKKTHSYDDIANCPPKFRNAGLREMFEVIWQSP